jgi:hypothetical protein
VKTSENYGRMAVQYGVKCMGQRRVSRWIKIFKRRRMTDIDNSHLGQPSIASCVEVKEQISKDILKNLQISTALMLFNKTEIK